MSRALVAALLALACSASQTPRERVLQTAIEAGNLACLSALNDPNTKWGPGAREYCVRMTEGCPVAP